MKTKAIEIKEDVLFFDNGQKLKGHHDQDCCEHHWLSMENLSIDDFKGLEFDLSNDRFFERVVDYGIRLIPVNGFPISIPGYGSNNGYYSSNLDLIVTNNKGLETFYDITECQDYTPD